MPNLDDIRDEDLRDGREIDREIEKEEKSEQRIKEAVFATIQEADLKDESREVIIAMNIMRSIEKDPVKPDDFKELQQSFAARLFSKQDSSGDYFMCDIENKSAGLAYDTIMQDMRNADERSVASSIINDILNEEKGLSAGEKSAACFAVVDILEKGGFEKTTAPQFSEAQRAEFVERAKEDGRKVYIEPERNEDDARERSATERAIIQRQLTEEISKSSSKFDASPVLEYRTETLINRVENSPFHDDKFKSIQESFLSAELKDDKAQTDLLTSKNPDAVMSNLLINSEREAFRSVMMEYRDEGKVSHEVAQDIFHTFIYTRDDLDEREKTAILSAAVDMMRNGELQDVKYSGKYEPVGSKSTDDEKLLSGIMDKIEKDGLAKIKEPEDVRDIKEDKLADSVLKDLTVDKDIEKDLRTVITASISENRLYTDDMKSDVADKTAELLKGVDIKREDIRQIIESAERQVAIDKITDGKDTLTHSQTRAVSYLEKLDTRPDLKPEEKTANRTAILDAYSKGLIPDKEECSRRAERSVIHNISMDAKDRIAAASAVERLERDSRDESKLLQDRLSVEFSPRNSEALDAGLSRIDKSMLDDSLKDIQKEKFAESLASRCEGGREMTDKDVREILESSERAAIIDRITSGTGSIDAKDKENAVAVIDKLGSLDIRNDERTAACQKILDMYRDGKIPNDRTLAETKINGMIDRARKDGRDEIDRTKEERAREEAAALKKEGREPVKEQQKNEPREERTDPKADDRTDGKKEKPERQIGVDPEKDAKDEAKNSKKTWMQDAKEIWEKSADIYNRKVLNATHHTDTTLSQSERDIVERSIKLRQELIDKNNAEKAGIIEKNIQLTKEGKDIPKEVVERLGKLERYNNASEREIYKMKQMVDPEYIRARELVRPACESKEHLKKELEEKTVYPDPSDKRLFHFREDALHWRHHQGIMERVTYEACLYAGLTGRHPSSVAGKDISTFEVRNNSLPAMCFTRAMEDCRHSEGARMYLEIFKIDGRKAKPLEINNVCAVLDKINKSDADERTKSLQRSVLADLCRERKIGNTKANDAYHENLYQKTVTGAKDRMIVKDPVKEGVEREYRKDDLRKELTKVPEKTDREIVKYILNTKEKVDLQALLEISRDAKESMREANGGQPVPMEPYQLSKQELKQIVCGANPEALSVLYPINMKLPEGAELNIGMYERAVEVIKGTNEQNDTVKMAMVNFALSKDGSFRSLDGEEGQRLEVIEKNSTLLVKSLADMSAKHELVKVIRQDLRETIKTERQALKEMARAEQRVIDYDRSPDKILRDVSRSIGNICRSEEYSREKLETKILEVREGMKYHRNTYFEDFKTIKTRNRGLKPNDAIAVAATDPRMFIPIQRAGISIGMNGLINESRLNDTIMKMETIPKDEVVVRMGVLEKNFIDHKNNGMDLNNAINMGNREDTRDANNLALWLYARDNGLKFHQPTDERERQALDKNIDTLRKCEDAEKFEKQFTLNLGSAVGEKDLERSMTFTSINKDMLPVASLAVRADYPERLDILIEDMRSRSDAGSKDVKESIQILETLSRLSVDDRAATMDEKSTFNRSYDETGTPVDVNLESRFVAIRAIERIYNIENSVFDRAGIVRESGKPTENVAKETATKIDEKAKRLFYGFDKKAPTLAEADVAREYIRNNGYDSKMQLNARPDAADEKAEFLVNMGYEREACASRADGKNFPVRYLYSEKNIEKISAMYSDLKTKVDGIRDNYGPDGKASLALQREHLIALDGLDKEMEKTSRIYQYTKDRYSVPKDKIPSLMIDVTSRENMSIREDGLKGMPMYKGATNLVSVGKGRFEDRMMFLKNTAFYPNPIDKVKDSVQIEPFRMSAEDIRTIMNNREKLVDCGIQYTIDFSNGYGYPTFAAAGLNDISVSMLPENLYYAITRSCSAEDFKEIRSMRHNEEFYKMAAPAATAYQKYYADYSRNISKRPENFERHVNDLYGYFDLIRDTRNEIFSLKNVDDADKTAVYVAIEYSRQQLFEMAPRDALNEAMRRWGNDNETTFLTIEHAAKQHYEEIIASEYVEIERDVTPFEMAKELSERLGYDLDDFIAFTNAYDDGLITDDEYNRARLNYDFFGGIDEQEYLREHANDVPDFPEENQPMDGYDDYRDERPIDSEPIPEMEQGDYSYWRQEDEGRTVYSDEPSFNTPFAGLFNGLNLDFERDNPVIGEDELDMGGQMYNESEAAFYEERPDDDKYNQLTERDIERLEEVEKMNLGLLNN